MSLANFICGCLSLLPCHDNGIRTFDSVVDIPQIVKYQVTRHEAPKVIVPGALPGSESTGHDLSSADTPDFWSIVPAGPLNVVVTVPVPPNTIVSSNGVQLFLDGRPVSPDRYVKQKDKLQNLADGSLVETFVYSFACPSPGKHLLQARYLQNNVWSKLSPPVHLRVLTPPRPKIVGVSDSDANDYRGPLFRGAVQVRTNHVHLKLGNVENGDLVIGYLNGMKLGIECADDCCVTFCLQGKAVPGTHTLAVRAIPNSENSDDQCDCKKCRDEKADCSVGSAKCQVASPLSNLVKIHFYNEDVYLLQPGMAVFECDCKKKKVKCRKAKRDTTPDIKIYDEPPQQLQEKLLEAIFEEFLGKTLAKPLAKALVDPLVKPRTIPFDEPYPIDKRFEELPEELPKMKREVPDSENQNLEIEGPKSNQYIDPISSTSENRNSKREQNDPSLKPRKTAPPNKIRLIGFSAFPETVLAAYLTLPQQANDVEIEAARKAKILASQLATDTENSVNEANDILADIHALETSADKLAAQAEAFSRQAINDIAHATNAEFEAAAVKSSRHTSALAEKQKAQVESDQASLAGIAARKDAEQTKQVSLQANVPMQNARNALVSAQAHQTACNNHAANAIDFANKATEAAAARNNGLADQYRRSAQAETASALEDAKKIEQFADAAKIGMAAVQKKKSTIEQLIKQVKSFRDQSKSRADSTRQHVRNAQGHARQIALTLIGNNTSNLTKVNKQVKTNEVSLKNALVHIQQANDAILAARKTKADAIELANSTIQVRNAAITANNSAQNAYTNSKQQNQAWNTVRAEFRNAEEDFRQAESEWKTVGMHSDIAESHFDLANTHMAEAKRQLDAAAIYFNKAQTAMQAAVADANTGKVRSVIAHLNSVDAESAKGWRATTNARIATDNTYAKMKVTADSAHASANSLIRARQHRVAMEQHGKHLQTASTKVVALAKPVVALAPVKKLKKKNVGKAKVPQTRLQKAIKTAADAADDAKTEIDIATKDAHKARSLAIARAATSIDLKFDKPARGWATRTFYLASAAHFPLRKFGPQGDVIEREGAIIYEDMEFKFYENGVYVIKFLVSTPNLPTNIQMQFQVQAREGGPWFTLTMPHRKFEPQEDGTRGMHPQEFRGQSEILKRCFGEVCKIRRVGSAQFGFGIAGLDHIRLTDSE